MFLCNSLLCHFYVKFCWRDDFISFPIQLNLILYYIDVLYTKCVYNDV